MCQCSGGLLLISIVWKGLATQMKIFLQSEFAFCELMKGKVAAASLLFTCLSIACCVDDQPSPNRALQTFV